MMITTISGEEITLNQAIERFQVSPIIKMFKQWALTEHGLECLVAYYYISKTRFGENWVLHMSEKEWVDIDDFKEAFAEAVVYHSS